MPPTVLVTTQESSFWGLPAFLWQGIFTVLSTLVCGILVAYVTSTVLRKKEERTRLAGLIVEKRIQAEQMILHFLEQELFKEEFNKGNSILADREFLRLAQAAGMKLSPYGALQYAVIFLSPERFSAFFHQLESLISEHKLWIDERVRQQLYLIQGYFSWINTIPLLIKRVPLPADCSLSDAEFALLHQKALLLFGIFLDQEINHLCTELEECVVDSVYHLDLSRPKKSLSRNGMNNRDLLSIHRKLGNRTLLGREREKFFALLFQMVYSLKGLQLEALSPEERQKILRRYYPEEFPDAQEEEEAHDTSSRP